MVAAVKQLSFYTLLSAAFLSGQITLLLHLQALPFFLHHLFLGYKALLLPFQSLPILLLFERLQRSIFNGQVKTVVIWKLDRLSRKMRDGINVLCEWCDRGVRVVSVTQQIDLSGTVGKMIAAVLLGVAEMEQETRREREWVFGAECRVVRGQGEWRYVVAAGV